MNSEGAKAGPAIGQGVLVGVALMAAFLVLFGSVAAGRDQLPVGASAPPFSLAGIDGHDHALSPGNGRSIKILYFFDPESQSSRHGLRFLADLAAEQSSDALQILAVTRSSAEGLERVVQTESVGFPILPNTGQISDLYGAKTVLPMAYVLTADLAISGVLVGGGEGNEIRLARMVTARLRDMVPPKPEQTFETIKQKGIDSFTRKAYEEAESYLLQALSKQQDATAYLYLAYSQMELGKKAEVGTTLRQAISDFPGEIRLYRLYVRYLIDQGEQAEALRVLEQALALSPDDINLNMLKDYVVSLVPDQKTGAADEH